MAVSRQKIGLGPTVRTPPGAAWAVRRSFSLAFESNKRFFVAFGRRGVSGPGSPPAVRTCRADRRAKAASAAIVGAFLGLRLLVRPFALLDRFAAGVPNPQPQHAPADRAGRSARP